MNSVEAALILLGVKPKADGIFTCHHAIVVNFNGHGQSKEKKKASNLHNVPLYKL